MNILHYGSGLVRFSSMPRTRPSRIGRARGVLLGLFVATQAPGVAALAALTGSWYGALAIAGTISAPYLPQLAEPWRERRQSRAGRGALLGFYVWWAACLSAWLLAPLVLLVASATGLPQRTALIAASVLSLAAGLRALWPHPRVVGKTLALPNLPPAFDGYRIVHLSDVHCGPWTPPRRVREWVTRINGLGADAVAVTGDLITSGAEYVPAVTAALGGLRAPDGVFACMGNHDYFTDGEAFARALDGAGLVVLRNRGVVLRRGTESLYLAGVDDTWTERDDVDAALAHRPPGTAAVLLSHDPALFPEAVARRVELTLSGHTHGGQIAVPGLARRLNLARLVSQFSVGIYRCDGSTLHVSRGAGTTGPPIRLGAPSEITVITLRARPADQPAQPFGAARACSSKAARAHRTQ